MLKHLPMYLYLIVVRWRRRQWYQAWLLVRRSLPSYNSSNKSLLRLKHVFMHKRMNWIKPMTDLHWGKCKPILWFQIIQCQMPMLRKRWKTVVRRLKSKVIRSWTSLLQRDTTLALLLRMSSYLWMQDSPMPIKLKAIKPLNSWITAPGKEAWLLVEESVMALVNSWIEWVLRRWKTYISTRGAEHLEAHTLHAQV